MERPSFLRLRTLMREAPTPTGAALHQAQGAAPKRLKANSRSLQRLMLPPPGAESILSRESLCVAALGEGQKSESASREARGRGGLGALSQRKPAARAVFRGG
jgi:hypothetical protein